MCAGIWVVVSCRIKAIVRPTLVGTLETASSFFILIQSVSQPFLPKALRHCHALTIRDSTSSYKTDYLEKERKMAEN